MIFWLFVAVFHLRRETQTMPFSQRDQFAAKAKTVLGEMGYVVISQRSDTLTFRPRFHSYLFGGGIHIALEEQETVTGPRCRLNSSAAASACSTTCSASQVYLKDHRKITDNIIKRAELRLRLTPEQFEGVRRNVIQLLEKDAEIVCELNLLVQSEQGIPEDVLEFQVREWLEKQKIEVDIHKDLVQFVEVVPAEREAETALSYALLQSLS